MQMLETIWLWVISYGLNLLGAVAIVFIGRKIAVRITNMTGKLLERNGVDETLVSFLKNLLRLGLMAIVLIMALNLIGFETTSIIAVLGAATLTIGFALQDSLSNFAAGVMIVFFKPYGVGDFVEVNGAIGFVEEVQVFNTMLVTLENNQIIVANSAVLGSNIINYSAHGSMRLDMVFGIGYGDDLLKAKSILEDILKEQPEVLEDPAPIVAVLELGDSSVNFAVQPFVKTEDYWTVHFNTHEQVKLRFDAEGISIPYPTQDIHLIQAKG